jgi:biotin carboxylase
MLKEIRRLAIVNRGEPAMRAITAAGELNLVGDQPPITTVVLHTDPDAQARSPTSSTGSTPSSGS